MLTLSQVCAGALCSMLKSVIWYGMIVCCAVVSGGLSVAMSCWAVHRLGSCVAIGPAIISTKVGGAVPCRWDGGSPDTMS